MKKSLLLFFYLGLTTLGASAQSASSTLLTGSDNKYVAEQPAASYMLKAFRPYKESTVSGMTTASAPRTYNYFNHINGLTGLFDDGSGTGTGVVGPIPIWSDSTILQRFTTGYKTVNFSSVCQMIDPTGSLLFNDAANPNYAGKLKITSANAFTVDSVIIDAMYIGNASRPSTIVDTLIISLANQDNSWPYWSKSTASWVAGYIGSKDTLWGTCPISVDSVRRVASSFGSGAPAATVWKVALTDAMRDYTTGPTVNKFFAFAPPSTYTVPAGNRVLISVTFKSGDTWVRNTDSITMYHRFMPIAGGSDKIMPNYWYTFGDRNGASLMFSTAPSQYVPSMVIEGTNSVDFRYEFLDISAVLSCPTCGTVGGTNINDQNIVSSVAAYPNPAIENLTIPFTVKESADVRVCITNAVGQVVASQDMGRYNANQSGKAIFSTGSLSSGVYFYTVEANGQHVTNRMSVTH